MRPPPFTLALLVAALIAIPAFAAEHDELFDTRRARVRAIIAAVNTRDADAYVASFAPQVKVYMLHGGLRIDGREALRRNRAHHFARYPEVRNELVHLAVIDDRVVMHDRVRLTPANHRWADIVEIFTFQGDAIVRVDVLQPSDLFP